MLRAVADTNVVISALLWRGAPHRLFSRIEPERICFYASRALLDELAGVLARRRLLRAVHATGKSVPTLVSGYQALVRLVEPGRLPAPVSARSR